jgi:hypothetical protein
MRIITGLLAVVALAPAARADFTIVGSSQPAVGRTAPAAIDKAPEMPTSQDFPHATAARRRPPPRSALVQGFGEQISLSFAVKQIVPLPVKVTYGRGVDPAALVDWKGGAAWDRVLLAAVNPLGLHLVITGKAVEIRK